MKKTPPKKIPWEMLVKAKHETEIRPQIGEHHRLDQSGRDATESREADRSC